MKFLFWNLKGNDSGSWPDRKNALLLHLSRMVSRYQIDCLLLAESKFDVAELTSIMDAQGNQLPFMIPDNQNERFQVAHRNGFSPMSWVYNTPDTRLSIWKIPAEQKSFLLCLVHMPDQGSWAKESVSEHAGPIVDQIRIQESLSEPAIRTVIVGDFNLDPYDSAMVSTTKFAAMATRGQVRERTIQKRGYRLFYNPMWSHFGDRSPGPPGTYFYSSAQHIDIGWHMFDQVLLSEAIMDELQNVEILDTDGIESLTTEAGRPKKDSISDHLPVLFTLK